MAITIQELLASDTISQAVDKINFNFDQLLLNGGGPVGPSGPLGPIGPTGGRGLRGSKWYEDPNATATDPNTLIFSNVEADDNYLDADGSVWNYNGTLWTITTVNLTGPQGSSGLSAGFAYFGNNITTGQQSIYPTPSPNGTTAGATVANEGIPTLVVGAVVSSTVNPPSGVTLTDAYKLTNTLATSIDSPITAMFVHQKDSSANAITFHGGGAIAAENFEQNDYSNLANIKLDADDKLQLNVPKPPTSPVNAADLLAFSVNTLKSGQQYYSGKQIQFSTGNDTSLALASEISDFTITVNTSNTSNRAKFQVSTTDANSSALLQLGGNITVPASTTKTGTILAEGNTFNSITSGTQQFTSSTNTYNFSGLASVSGTGSTGFVTVDNAGRLRSINLSGGGAIGNGVLSLDSGNLEQSTGTDNRITRWDGTNKIQSSSWTINDAGVLYPSAGLNQIGTGTTNGVTSIIMSAASAITVPYSATNYLNIHSSALNGIQINSGITAIGTLQAGQILPDSPSSSLRVLGITSGANRYGGRIEFQKASGTLSSYSPVIIGPKATSITDGKGSDDRLTIKGGADFGGSSNGVGREGRDVSIEGGSTNWGGPNAFGGDVYVSGGTNLANLDSPGNVYLGYDPSNGVANGGMIGIGAGPGDGIEGYLYVKQPSDSRLVSNAEDYLATFEVNRSTSAAKGLIRITTGNEVNMLRLGVAMTTSAFSSGGGGYGPYYTRSYDSVIVNSGTDSLGDKTGLTIINADRYGGIRLNSEKETVMLMGKKDRSLNQTAIDTSNKHDSLIGIYTEGDIHVVTNGISNRVNSVDKDEYILISGQCTANAAVNQGTNTNYVSDLDMNWTRVGRIVTVYFYLAHGSATATRILPFPITSSGSSGVPSQVFGSCTIYNNGGAFEPGFIINNPGTGGNGWVIKRGSGSSGSYFNGANQKAIGSFSYQLL
jgi:hypothetical protein